MTITREHLELAALAAGHEIVCELDAILGRDVAGAACGAVLLRGVQAPWRPHLDDGDAARLADKLLMYVDSRGTAVQARVVGAEWHRVARDGNPSAWREAVVLCAAAVGERMKGGA